MIALECNERVAPLAALVGEDANQAARFTATTPPPEL